MSISIQTCHTIDEVVDQLERITQHCCATRNKLGYFASLYGNVTRRVRQDIAAGRFEDGPRMERLDVVFANFYFYALDQYWQGKNTPASWKVAFQATRRRSPVILQHLLMGMNAHINLDLAVAAAQTAPGGDLAGLKKDFYQISDILSEMIDAVQERIDRLSPWFHIIDRVGGRSDEQICSFAIRIAREKAWETAEKLAYLPQPDAQEFIRLHDHQVAKLGLLIQKPAFPINLGLHVIRIRERHKVAEIISALQL